MELKARIIEVVSFLTEYQCDNCKLGRMVFSTDSDNNILLDKKIVKFSHVCNRCGFKGYLNVKYPFISHSYI